MNTKTLRKQVQSNVLTRLALCVAVMAGSAASNEAAALVISYSTPLIIPANSAGIYINLATGVADTTEGGVAGWDFNPHLVVASNQLGFNWNLDTSPGAAGVAATTSGPYTSLPGGTVVGNPSTFSSSILGTTGSPYLASGTHILGFRFWNESLDGTGSGTAGFNYGFMSITTSAGSGFPAVINGWSFDNQLPITVPNIAPVPEPSTGLMLSAGVLAFGASQLRRSRRKHRLMAK